MKALAAVMIATMLFYDPVIAVAQQPVAPPTYSFSGLTQQDIQVLGGALGARPYSEVAGLIAKLSQQAADQDKARALPAAPEAPK